MNNLQERLIPEITSHVQVFRVFRVFQVFRVCRVEEAIEERQTQGMSGRLTIASKVSKCDNIHLRK